MNDRLCAGCSGPAHAPGDCQQTGCTCDYGTSTRDTYPRDVRATPTSDPGTVPA